ncbi:MAG: hypothetical protein A3H94_00885 [Acidobacteria bacterium RIFCSPLOWO2_02_FULL_60_20]|nr:MAG: hypothetical protein A3H94_00885 [Acidobacteria bacterium RIFCSPLOWO2_02_FULL_60_20]
MTESTFPLLFTYQDTVAGQGFLAGITLSGRGLMVQENDGEWWMYGVRPGAIAESGQTPKETYLRFRNRYKEVLFDIANESSTFDEFKQEVERFFYQPDREEEQRWEDALKELRGGRQISEPFSKLPRQTPDERPSGVSVVRLDVENTRFMPSDNALDSYFIPLAA